VRPLQVDPLACSVGGQQKVDVRVVAKTILDLAPRLPRHPTVDHHHPFIAAEQRADPLPQVGQRVAVLGKDHQLPPPPLFVHHPPVVLHQRRQLFPLAVGPALPHAVGHRLQAVQRRDLGFQFGDGQRRRGAVHDLLLNRFQLLCRRVGQVGEVVGLVVARGLGGHLRGALPASHLCQALFQPLPAALQRLIDRFW